MASNDSDLLCMSPSSSNPDVTYIARAEYDRLIQISHYYASLRENLIRGGVTDKTVDLLSNVVAANQSQTLAVADASPQKGNENLMMESRHQNRYNQQTESTRGRAEPNWTEANESSDGETSDSDTPAFTRRKENDLPLGHETARRFVRHAERTILLSNLSQGVTHADITAVIRGGQLLEVFVRYKDQSATVSFLYEEDARAFYEHATKYDLYIRQKRVDVSWNDRQFILSDHIVHKIKLGASRNIVIRHYKFEHTEEEIRDDVEHIHNLAVVNVEFIGDNCFISTNSVAGAAFARTCMMSRRKYKGSRVEFGLDECAQPLMRPVPRRAPTVPFGKTSNSAMNTMANRFHLLDMDE